MCVYGCRSGSASRGHSLLGNTPSKPVEFKENGVKFKADVVVGQKTGTVHGSIPAISGAFLVVAAGDWFELTATRPYAPN